MKDSEHSIRQERLGRNIRMYQKGYDPVFVNWEKVLEKIEDDPTANKYVFNY